MIAAVVLSAGASTRFGSPKQAVLLEPVLERVRQSSSVAEIVVVLGAHELETSERSVHCPDWELGPGASLRCGLAAVGDDVDASVLLQLHDEKGGVALGAGEVLAFQAPRRP